ncbi:hypothetical protein V6N11_016022 [Hibiscus sabdariffa]|uniref:Uncharacterized protein n=1 Tax=Hibiscus sabdariffa TaxID=183260 RepID=A0ABR2TTR7_9ROSI
MPAGKSGCWAENGLEDILSKGSRGGLSWSEVNEGIRGGTSREADPVENERPASQAKGFDLTLLNHLPSEYSHEPHG